MKKPTDKRQRTRVNAWIKGEHAEAIEQIRQAMLKKERRLTRQDVIDDLLETAIRRSRYSPSSTQPAA